MKKTSEIPWPIDEKKSIEIKMKMKMKMKMKNE